MFRAHRASGAPRYYDDEKGYCEIFLSFAGDVAVLFKVK